MPTMQQLSLYAQTAQAAYAADLIPGANNTEVFSLTADMSESQAAQFDSTWNVLQQSTPVLNGFSAVLLENKATHEKVLAIAGTEITSPADILTDLVHIAAAGSIVGMQQYLSLLQFYQQLISEELLASDETFTVTGHSLGGFLAQAFAVIHSNVVTAAYTYNAPGFAGAVGQLADFLGVPSALPGATITNVRAADGLSATAGLGVLVGTPQDVRIEPDIIPTSNHSIIKLSDSLAVQGLLGQLDAGIAQSTSSLLVQSASNQSSDTLEMLLDAVRRVLIGPAVAATGVGDRNSLYANIQILSDSLSPAHSLASLAGNLHIGPVSKFGLPDARANFSVLVSLLEMSPLILSGSNPVNQATLDTVLSGVHAESFALWEADLALSAAERAAGKANFSDEWLNDRAMLLNLLAHGNVVNDVGPLEPMLGDGVARSYIDVATGTQIDTGETGVNKSKIIFGNSSDDSITGGNVADRLYGGAGADSLSGGGGDDYLEGGGGNDTLTSGSGRDILSGGSGQDVYWISGDAQHTTIRDADGAGAIVIEKADLSTYTLGTGIREIKSSTALYEDVQGNRYQLSGTTLTIQIKSGARTISIENFSSMSGLKLGLNLQGPETYVPPTGVPTYNVGAPNQIVSIPDPENDGAYSSADINGGGWHSPSAWFHAPQTEIIHVEQAIVNSSTGQIQFARTYGGFGDSHMHGDNGFNWLIDDQEAHYDDAVPGIFGLYQMGPEMGDDRIDAAGGNDWVVTRGGDDEVYGGSGDDWLIDSHAGWEARFAQGTSYLYSWGSTEWVEQSGHSSDDHMYGEDGNDYIAAHGGNQTMDGGADNDELYAGAGNDTLSGGAGNDVLGGDLYLYASPFQVSIDPFTGYMTNAVFNGNSLAGDTEHYGDDTLDGGDGNDTLFGGGGNDLLIGGAGNDRLQGDFRQGYSDLRSGIASLLGEPLEIHGIDTMYGGDGDDEVDGGGGDDIIDGGAGNDTIYGGPGNDTIQGGTGVDNILGDYSNLSQGNDEIHAGDQNDNVWGMGGNDRLYGDGGADYLYGGSGTGTGSGDDWIEGGDGNDRLFGEDGIDTLNGQAGSDVLQGGNGDDILIGSAGNDTLYGEGDNDKFVLSTGTGPIQISDTTGQNSILFGAGITAADLRVTLGINTVYLDFSPTDYAYMAAGTFAALGSVQFADGTTLTLDELRHKFVPEPIGTDHTVRLGTGVTTSEIGYRRWNDDLLLTYDGAVTDWFVAGNFNGRNVMYEVKNGSAYGLSSGTKVLALTNWYQSDVSGYVYLLWPQTGMVQDFEWAANIAPAVFTGSTQADVFEAGQYAGGAMSGNAGDDYLMGNDADDDLAGGADEDFLAGGAGNDIYRFNIGDGRDVIVDDGGTRDAIHFGAGILPGDLTVTEDALGLHVQVGPAGNSDGVLIANWQKGTDQTIDQFVFANGTMLKRNAIDALNSGNHSPRENLPVMQQRARIGQAFSYVIPAAAFTDADVGDTLTYEVTLADGSPLSGWLSFDPVTRTLSGTPTGSDPLITNLIVRATDGDGLFITAPFGVDILSRLDGTNGNDLLEAPGPNGYEMYGLNGVDDLYGGDGADEIYGGSGNDYISGGAGDDYIEGGIGDDYISGGDGVNVVAGGAGADFISLGYTSSATTVRINLGDGADRIGGLYEISRRDSIEFGAGITPGFVLANMRMDQDENWIIRYNPSDPQDTLTFSNYELFGEERDVRTLENQVRFVTGEVYTISQLFAAMNQLTEGNDSHVADGSIVVDALGGNDILFSEGNAFVEMHAGAGDDYIDARSNGGTLLDGGDGNDDIHGTTGVDTILGGAGDDRIQSNGGSDTLDGGAGNDRYSVTLSSGTVVQVADSAGWDVFSFFTDNLSTFQFSQDGDDLLLTKTTGSSSTRFQDWFAAPANRIERMEFSAPGGLAGFTIAQIEGLVAGVNTAPGVNWRLQDAGASVGQSFSYTIPALSFVDTETSPLTYSAQLADGNPLPGWLAFNALSRGFSGTPGSSDAATLDIVVTATDEGGLSVTDEFSVVVASGIQSGTNNNNTYNGTSSANVYFANGGNDTVNGNGGNDQLYGGEGNDTLSGGDGDDVLAGGAGNDSLNGGIGTNIYRLDPDDGTDTHVVSATGTHRFQFGAGITSAGLQAEILRAADGSVDLQVRYNADAASDVLLLKGVYSAVGNDLQFNSNAAAYSFEFRGSSSLTLGQLLALAPALSSGTTGDDFLSLSSSATIHGNEGADLIIGSAGADQIYGDEGNDRLYGMADADTLYGGSGNDVLSGGAGTDTAIGGTGDDSYVVDSTADVITENAAEGTDTVESYATYVLANHVEHLTLTGSAAINGTGNVLDNILTGNSGNNTLTGLGGSDTLDPGSAGTDGLLGGDGNDLYIVNRGSGITITENLNEGTDTVQATVTHTLASNVENLVLMGLSNINGTGNALVNTITGNSGNNTLSGGTGGGADTLIGGAGNDTYVVDSTGDVTTENADEGTDLVQSSVTYTLAANVENITLTGSSTLNATGNALDNVVTGNTGNNQLAGGAGNDTYVVQNTGDTVIENSGEGVDNVQSSATFTLGNYVENLTLTGSSAINATGNTLDNVITGNSGNNTLNGGGGNDTLDPGGTSGTDALNGGTGDDTYIVGRSTGITITENSNEGIDTVKASVTATLGNNIELLFLTGSSNINGTGNTLNNLLRGNAGNNTLAGGTGVDILEGGGGTDALSDSGGNTLFSGGAGTDTLTSGSSNDLLIGGADSDTLTTGSGADIIAFNKGDGQDTAIASTVKDNVLTIGGGAVYADLVFQKSGSDLILKVGGSDQLTFSGYYTGSNRSVDKLQIVIEGTSDYDSGSGSAMNNKKIETFDFDGLVTAYDTARALDPGLTDWALTNALLAQHLGGSDTAAIGGDLAYRYGRFGTLSDLSFTPAAAILAAGGFGSSAQTLQSPGSLQDTTSRLS